MFDTKLKQAGLAGSMDELRARAYIDLLLGTDSRPTAITAGSQSASGRSLGDDGSAQPDPSESGAPAPPDPAGPRAPAPAGPLAGVIPPGFAGKVNLTVRWTTPSGRQYTTEPTRYPI